MMPGSFITLDRQDEGGWHWGSIPVSAVIPNLVLVKLVCIYPQYLQKRMLRSSLTSSISIP
jgi:hypothetical protein